MAIEEGKSIFSNIQNFLRFQLSTSFAALFLIAVSAVIGMPSPLNAMQILWINIICDGPVAQSLGVEAVDPDVSRQPPRSKDAPIITKKLLINIALSSFCILLVTLFIYVRNLQDGNINARDRTLTFTAFVLSDMWNSFACRSSKYSSFSLPRNIFYNYAVVFCLVGQLMVIYVPFFQKIFQTEALSLLDLITLILASSTVLIVDESRIMMESKSNGLLKKGYLSVQQQITNV
jgi:Ca2+-transporting ATPase